MKSNESHELSIIDEQHSIYIKLLDDLCMSVMARNRNMAIRIFSDLTDYSKSHQEFEESLMKEINYPYLDTHLVEHYKLRDILKKIFENFDQMNIQTLISTLLEMKNDSISHILYTDMPLIRHYKHLYFKN